MAVIPKTRAALLSTAALFVGGALIVLCITKTFESGSDRYWPLLAVGFPLACAATPFYYYFKSRDNIVPKYHNAEIDALAAAGRAMQEAKKAEPRKTVKR